MKLTDKFEIIEELRVDGHKTPERSTELSAGYDFFAPEEVVIPSTVAALKNYIKGDITAEEFMKATKPVLVPTGIKVKLESNEFLGLFNRSSNPMKARLIMTNGVGVIDADYYNNPDNEGHIMFQFINNSTEPYIIHKGDKVGQGLILQYGITEDDNASGLREGGFGSSGK